MAISGGRIREPEPVSFIDEGMGAHPVDVRHPAYRAGALPLHAAGPLYAG